MTLAAALGGMLASLALERMPRTLAAVALQCALWCLAFLLFAALFRRPLLAAALALGLHGLIRVISRAKQRVLREPLVHADFALFAQALAHPRLYLPYLPVRPVLLLATALTCAVAAALALEPPSVGATEWTLLACASLATLGVARERVSLDPGRDVTRLGHLATAWLYWRLARAPLPDPRSPYATPLAALPARRPHIVVVQAESFFDPRRLGASLPAGVLAHFDALRRAGCAGRLDVPARGAYTMRSEFAFLSGTAPAALGVHRFDPYRRYARRRVPTIAWALKSLGYRTVCVHPYAADFFARDRVFGYLGFDRFLDIRSFAGAARAGPYIADREVARRILDLLEGEETPAFVFAITMENHGPLHLEASAAETDLAVYLRHLANADAMLGELAAALCPGDVLCAYGDHLPALPELAARGFEDPRTDYVVWRAGQTAAQELDLAVEDLGPLVLRTAGYGESCAAAPGGIGSAAPCATAG